MRFCRAILLILLPLLTFGDVQFNYEISSRVQDKISDFTLMIANAMAAPYATVAAGYINISDPLAAMRPLFYNVQVAYFKYAAAVYSGFENDQSYGYGFQSGFPRNMYCGWVVPSPSGFVSLLLEVNNDGSPGSDQGNWSYTVTGRPWYILAKQIRIPYWTTPYIDALSGYPMVSLIYPILNNTFDSEEKSFVGTIAMDIFLTEISTYLKQAYAKTDRNVFIVDKATLTLVGSSLRANTSIYDPATNYTSLVSSKS